MFKTKATGTALPLNTIPLLVLCACVTFAQTPNIFKGQAETSSPMGITAVLAGPLASIPGAPYSAKAVTQRIQTLSDGNHITQTTTNKVARDSKGRVYREESLPGHFNSDGEAPLSILIEDPVAGLHITLDPTSKTAFKIPAADRKKADETAFIIMQPSDPGPGVRIFKGGATRTDDMQSTSTDLGTQTIEGVSAKGTKVTHVIPAGAIGNDGPLVITTETWFSPELKVLVMSKSSDPRMGETTYKLTNISRAEPDPSLFQVPSDYTWKDKPANLLYFKTDKD